MINLDYYAYMSYEATKKGYYTIRGENSSALNSYRKHGKKKDSFMLMRPVDYLNKEFATRISDDELKIKTLNFIDLILLEGLLTESVLVTNSINLISFKNNDYLQFKFTNNTVYNSLQLDKYEIGKRLFDEVIRKILDPLNEYITDSKLFYGYDLAVIGHTKSFAQRLALAESIEYRFMIPESIVKRYKNKDLTGQQLLDESIILMDNERIELKLQ